MATTYLQLVNEVLREHNEVELTSANFASARGVHARAKDAVNVAIRQMGLHETRWPWYAMEHTQVLTKGTYEYAWPDNFKIPDWNSFQIQIDANVSITRPITLHPIERDEWYRYRRDDDETDTTDGRGIPKYVFQTHGDGYGVSPNPDAAYTIKFRYYKYTTALSAHDDTMDVPDQYKDIVTFGANKVLYRMLDGVQYSMVLDEDFQMLLDDMRQILVNDELEVYSGFIPRGSRVSSKYTNRW